MKSRVCLMDKILYGTENEDTLIYFKSAISLLVKVKVGSIIVFYQTDNECRYYAGDYFVMPPEQEVPVYVDRYFVWQAIPLDKVKDSNRQVLVMQIASASTFTKGSYLISSDKTSIINILEGEMNVVIDKKIRIFGKGDAFSIGAAQSIPVVVTEGNTVSWRCIEF